MASISRILSRSLPSTYKGTFFAGKDVTGMKRWLRKPLPGEASRRIVGNDDRSE
jgi:hypothetical protein